MTITLITLKKVLYALFLFLFVVCDKSYSMEFVENPRCIEWLDGEIVGLYKNKNGKTEDQMGYIKLGGDLIGGVIVDVNIIDNLRLHIGMKLPHKELFCLAYYGGHHVVRKKDGTECYIRYYLLTSKILPENYLEHLDEALLPHRNVEVENLYPHCGSDFSKLKVK